MAYSSSHHHHHHSHQQQQINHCNSCTSCCTNSTPCNPLPAVTPAPNPSDQLLQALATSLLLQSQPQPQFQPPVLPPVPVFYNHEHYSHATNQHQHPFQFPHKTHNPNPLPNPIPNAKSIDPLKSLFDRVAALESSLFTNPIPNPVFPAQRSNLPAHNSSKYSSNRRYSLRDLAARTIQLHFRLFLVRRSQILRDLKRLAVMKCHVASLKSAVSHRAEIDPKMVSDRAADLLLQLDSIRSVDVMIHEGKRSIERELIRIVDFIDKIFLREQEISLRDKKSNRKDSSSSSEEEEDESIPDERKVKKNVSFEEKNRKPRELEKEERGDCFELPNGVFDKMNFEEIEGVFGKKKGMKNGGFMPPFPTQMEMRRSDETREK